MPLTPNLTNKIDANQDKSSAFFLKPECKVINLFHGKSFTHIGATHAVLRTKNEC